MEDLSIEEVRRALTYDPETGKLIWKWRDDVPQQTNSRFAGKEGFTSNSNGYRIGLLNGRCYTAHRVAWAIHHGWWPTSRIHHKNGDRKDNRIENLTLEKQESSPRNMYKNNKSGHTGVAFFKRTGKWMAYVSKMGKQVRLGYFETKELAIAARKAFE